MRLSPSQRLIVLVIVTWVAAPSFRALVSPGASSANFVIGANVVTLLLVVPVALIGKRFGRPASLAASAVALLPVLAYSWLGDFGTSLPAYLICTTALVVIALVAGGNWIRQAPAAAPEPALPAVGESVDPDAAGLLSKRELEVFELIVEGATNSEIADRLCIEESTVKSHVGRVLRKLGVRNRTEAAVSYAQVAPAGSAPLARPRLSV
jgi:DNA-binding CsgD family transcriptional regulator